MEHTTAAATRKVELRRLLRAQRRGIPLRQRRAAERRALRHLLRTRLLASARHIALYLSMASEFDTQALCVALAKRGKRIYAPRVHRSGTLRFVRLSAGRLRRHAHGMPQPSPGPSRPLRRLDLLLLPLLGYDDAGRRLGQGGGYYDRTLARLGSARRPLRIGLAHSVQRVDALPVEDHDQPLHAVLTERGLRRFRSAR